MEAPDPVDKMTNRMKMCRTKMLKMASGDL